MSTAVVAAIKAVISILTNEESRKKVGWILAVILAPFIIIIAVICVLASGSANHNVTAMNLSFNGGYIGNKVPAEYKEYIEDMRSSFTLLDSTISTANGEMEDGDSLDSIRVKAVFYALYFGEDSPSRKDHASFVACFYTEETRTREVETTETITHEDGSTTEETTTETEEYIVFVPITDLSVVYSSIGAMRGIPVTHENMVNANEIYYRMKYGTSMNDAGSLGGINSIPLSGEPFVGMDGFTVPIAGVDWQDVVTSEFGPRNFAPAPYHTGIDFGIAYGSSIYSALDGTVVYARHSGKGFGNHVVVDHGGGTITLYAHCSSLLVVDGQAVTAGQEIAKVGSTGLSTNPHLHFEIRENGTSVNPRSYLPTGQTASVNHLGLEETVVHIPENRTPNLLWKGQKPAKENLLTCNIAQVFEPILTM